MIRYAGLITKFSKQEIDQLFKNSKRIFSNDAATILAAPRTLDFARVLLVTPRTMDWQGYAAFFQDDPVRCWLLKPAQNK